MRYLIIFLLLLLPVACSQTTAPVTSTQPDPTATWVKPTTTAAPTATTPPSEPTGTPAPTDNEVNPSPTPKPALQFPDSSGYTWQQIASGLDTPVGITNAGDETRLFIIEQPGRIRILVEGTLLPAPFLDLSDQVSRQSEQGLLGLAFHPQYSLNGFFYVNFTDLQGNTVIARYQVRQDNPNQADPESEQRLLYLQQPFANHNGGGMAFGPDGYLYLGLGDGGSGGDPLGNGQSTGTFLGKILRIDVNHSDPYAIPPDNPFANGGGEPEIWAYGLRNPWRFSFDRQTGDLYIGDVGQSSFEELDFQPANSPGGVNYGWNIMEGYSCYNAGNCDTSGLTLPVFDYPTHAYNTCSVVGGVVYRGPNLPEWQGIYLYGDYCSGDVGGLLPGEPPTSSQMAWQQAWLFRDVGRITSFGEDRSGEVYLTDFNGGIFKLVKK
jgi:glucose/arabinose dehydrogenase